MRREAIIDMLVEQEDLRDDQVPGMGSIGGVDSTDLDAVGADSAVHLAASFLPSTADDKTRKIRCVAYSGASVARYDWRTGEEYDLSLSLEKGAVRLGRMKSGAPVANAHDIYSVESVLGVVERAWIEDKQLLAEVRFSERDSVTPVWQDVKSGILRNWSIGLWIHQRKDTTEKDSKRRQMMAIDWEPFELSLVPVPADAKAVSMSVATTKEKVSLASPQEAANPPLAPSTGATAHTQIQKETKRMENPLVGQGSESLTGQTHTPPAPAITPAQLKQAELAAAEQARKDEQLRAGTIRTLCTKFKMPDTFTSNLIDTGVTVEQARAAIMDSLAAETDRQPPTHSQIEMGVDASDKLREQMSAALLYRWEPTQFKSMREPGREFIGFSLMEMAKHCLSLRGEKWRGRGPSEVAMSALTTSDFANILADVSNKSLRKGYEATPQTFRPFCRRVTAPDFKTVNRVQLSNAPALQLVNENGEFKHGAFTDSKETYALVTWGRLVAITRQTIINDDLSALTRVPSAMGMKASQLESDVVWAIVTANGNMADGNPLFDATHGNLGTTGAIGVTTVDEAYTDMSLQTDPSGDVLGLEPRYLLIPTGKRALASQFLNPLQFAPTSTANVIPNYMRDLTPIAESRLQAHSTTAYYFACDPNTQPIDTIEYCYLEGEEGVYQDQQMGFNVDGVTFKVRLDFGAGAVEHRGLYKNAGS